MSTTLALFLLLAVLSTTLLLPAKYKGAVLRAPFSLFGGMLRWGLIMLGIVLAVIFVIHVAHFLVPP